MTSQTPRTTANPTHPASRIPGRTAPASYIPGRAPAWQRRFRRHRRILAALVAGVVVWSLASAVSPAAPSSRPVVVALHDLAPGSRLRLDDVAVQPRPDQGLPDDAVADPASLLGRTVVFPVHAGEVTTARAVVSDTLLSAFGPDVRATPVHLADDTSSLLLRAGDVVDVLSASAAHIGDTPGTARAVVVASRVRVLVAPSVATTTGGPLSTGGTPSSQVLVLATTADEALALAAAAVSGHLSVTVRTP